MQLFDCASVHGELRDTYVVIVMNGVKLRQTITVDILTYIQLNSNSFTDHQSKKLTMMRKSGKPMRERE